MASKVSAPKFDIYDRLTDIIVTALESAVSPTEWPWIKAAQGGTPINVVSGKTYRGVNRLVLGMAVAAGADRRWGTFNQWQGLGAMVRKGSKGTPVAYFGELFVDENDRRVDPGTPGAKKIIYAKGATVFSADQVDGWNGATVESATGAGSLDEVESFIAATGAIIEEKGEHAFYSLNSDKITMPMRRLFRDTAEASATVHFYSVALHELTHWTGAKTRCNREFGTRFGDSAYAFEELVAEMASAFLAADLGIAPIPNAKNLDYLAHWLKILKGDKKALMTAGSAASKAADFLHGLQPSPVVTADEDVAEAA